MNYSSEDLRYDMQQVIDNHPHDSSAKQAIQELAENIGIRLKPIKVEVEGYGFLHTYFQDGQNKSEAALFSSPSGGDTQIMLYPLLQRAGESPYDWARKKYKLTLEEVLD